MEIVRTILDPDKHRKLDIFRRPDGTFGFSEWKWAEPEQSWVLVAGSPKSRIDSLEHALEEVKGRAPWVIEVLASNN